LPPDAKNPGKNEENRLLLRVLPVGLDDKHHIWHESKHSIPQFVSRKNPRDRRKKDERSKQTFIFKKFKKVGKKYMKVVTNGGMWCILTV